MSHLWINIPAIMAFTESHPLLSVSASLQLLLGAASAPAECYLSARMLGQESSGAAIHAYECLRFCVGPPLHAFPSGNRPLGGLAFRAKFRATSLRIEYSIFAHWRDFKRRLIWWNYLLPFVPRVLGSRFRLCSQSFRLLRYPATVLAGLITVSTMTTGWHYGVDVIAGLFLAAITTLLANRVLAVGHSSTESLSMSH